ncbi:MAG: VTT domain-containing protein [archaeon]|nr:VTT domain-containing protein [archaeon]
MDWLFSNLQALLLQFGYLALFAIVFAESGLFFGFFLPGDSLLFVAGLLASQGYFKVFIVWLVIFLGAVLGDQAGYWMGKKWGRGFFVRPDSWLFNPKRLIQAEAFYQKHGKKTIVLARFVPAVRTFTPIFAGISQMDYSTFVKFNVLGGFLWTTIFVAAGYFLGKTIPDAENYLPIIVLGVIVLSFMPLALEYLKNRGK